MKIAIIGGGASGVLAAILIKKENIDHDVYIFEHENKLLKKLLATGNGRCNLGNAKIDINKYRNKDFAKNILKGYNVKQTFSSLGIEIKNIDNLYYPYSESSQSVYNVLIDNLEKEHVKIHLEENIIDYKSQNDKIELLTKLNFWGNEIGDVSIIRYMPQLEIISLSLNKIKTLKWFARMENLIELHLRENLIEDIQKYASHLEAKEIGAEVNSLISKELKIKREVCHNVR